MIQKYVFFLMIAQEPGDEKAGGSSGGISHLNPIYKQIHASVAIILSIDTCIVCMQCQGGWREFFLLMHAVFA